MPTIAEAGVAGYVVDSWQGVFVPAKTPPDIVHKMSADIVAALADAGDRRQARALRLYGAAARRPTSFANF